MSEDRGVTEADVDRAVARAFQRDRGASADHTVNRPAAGEVSEADMDRAVARAFGREYVEPPRTVHESVIDQLQAEAAAAADHAPWRDECPWGKRDALRGAEEHLADLYSTRRGESLESARRTATAALREAWEHPTGLGLSRDRFDAVVRALDEGTRRLEALQPISATSETSSRRPGRMVNVVKEVRP